MRRNASLLCTDECTKKSFIEFNHEGLQQKINKLQLTPSHELMQDTFKDLFEGIEFGESTESLWTSAAKYLRQLRNSQAGHKTSPKTFLVCFNVESELQDLAGGTQDLAKDFLAHFNLESELQDLAGGTQDLAKDFLAHFNVESELQDLVMPAVSETWCAGTTAPEKTGGAAVACCCLCCLCANPLRWPNKAAP